MCDIAMVICLGGATLVCNRCCIKLGPLALGILVGVVVGGYAALAARAIEPPGNPVMSGIGFGTIGGVIICVLALCILRVMKSANYRSVRREQRVVRHADLPQKQIRW